MVKPGIIWLYGWIFLERVPVNLGKLGGFSLQYPCGDGLVLVVMNVNANVGIVEVI